MKYLIFHMRFHLLYIRYFIYEGLSRSSWTNVKKLTIIIGLVCKFMSINLDITMKSIQNFIQKYKQMTKLHAID